MSHRKLVFVAIPAIVLVALVVTFALLWNKNQDGSERDVSNGSSDTINDSANSTGNPSEDASGNTENLTGDASETESENGVNQTEDTAKDQEGETAMDTGKQDTAELQADITVTLQPDNASKFNDGRFEGWGTSLCWWANRIGYSDVLAEKAASYFFNKEEGLGLNIARYNIGGGDDPAHKHIKRTDSAVPGYLYWNETTQSYEYDWTADANQRNVVEKAIQACGDEIIVEAFSNSPPYFMTESGCSSGSVDGSSDNLKKDQYDDFAEYLAEVALHFKTDYGIEFQSISPMNEPYTNYWKAYSNKQEGCHFDIGSSQSNILIELSKSLNKRGLDDIIISGTDETSIDTQISAFRALSSETKDIISRIDTHTYGGSHRSELKALAEDSNKNLWMSEVDGGSTLGDFAGEMGAALWLGQRIIDDMNGMMPSAWILWQIIDSHISVDGYNGNKDTGMVNTSGGYWGTAVANHETGDIILTKKYYGFGQFTRYIRPGFTIIASSGTTLAAYDRENNQLVIVAVNSSSADKTCDFDLSRFKSIGDSVKVIRTSGNVRTGENWAELESISTYETGFYASLKGYSITTFILDEVVYSGESLQEIPLASTMVTGSTPWNNTPNVAGFAVDGDVATFFDGVEDGWLQIDLGKSYTLDAISYAPRQGFAYRCVDAAIYGSQDGQEWEILYTIKFIPADGYNFVYKKDIEAANPVRYIKYMVPSGKPNNGVNNDGGYCCNIADIKLYGSIAE